MIDDIRYYKVTMTKMSLVSIIIPIYRVSDYVERCITSVLRQTYAEIECIIVDDATDDDSMEKCERNLKMYEGSIDFKIIHHDLNMGLSAARNTGIKMARGEYVYFLDSDDEITPRCIELLMAAATKRHDAEMVVGNFYKHKEGKEKKRKRHEVNLPAVLERNEEFLEYYHQHMIAHSAWNKLVKRSFIERYGLYFEEGVLYEDYLWSFYVAKYLSVVALVKDVTYNYYVRPGSITMDADDGDVGRSYAIIYDDILHNLTQGREKKELTYCAERFCKHYLKQKSCLPEFKGLHKLYMKLAWKHNCWYAEVVLLVVGAMGIFGNTALVLRPLHYVKWKIKELALNA